MDCVSPILDVATRLWDCTAKRAVYVCELQENLDSLKDRMEKLKRVHEDVKGMVERAEKEEMKRTNEVDGWLRDVQAMETQVKEILQQGEEELKNKCLRICPKHCRSSYKLGKIVNKKISAVNELRNNGSFHVVAVKRPLASVNEMPMEKTVGLDSFRQVWRWLEDEQVRSIGIYGIGGIGKTTLLKKINNEFLNANLVFDVVIWVVVSNQANVEKVQLDILGRLEIPDEIWKNKSKEDRAAEILKALKGKKFLLLLDDVWNLFDYVAVGIPPLDDQNQSKVILTTRSEKLCDEMQVHERIKLEGLEWDEASALFREKVGEKILNSHPDIQKLADVVVEKCRGVPLALITTA